MKERPIIFNSEMVKAILNGQKTQTRRIIKPQPVLGKSFRDWIVDPDMMDIPIAYCPFGILGDQLWVREIWQLLIAQTVGWGPGPDDWDWEAEEAECIPKEAPELGGTLIYKADDPDMAKWWRPSIHMPHWASRINLEIINIKVERLQEITEADAIAEGYDFYGTPSGEKGRVLPVSINLRTTGYGDVIPSARRWFMDIWDSINAKRGFSWESNPWCWCLVFRVFDR